MNLRLLAAFGGVVSVFSLAACSGMGSMSGHSAYSQASLPAAVQVPAGHRVALEAMAAGDITYECRVKAQGSADYEWAFVGPDAPLMDRSGKRIGRYWGPPATWESMDGSKVTGAQVAVAPNGTGNIPHQLVKANPAMGQGAMSGVSYIQRVNTIGGVAPAMPCGAASAGQKQVVKYRADYIFYRAG